MAFPAYTVDRGQLFLRVQRSVLGREGNIDHTRLYKMLMALIRPVGMPRLLNLLCPDLSIFRRKRQHLMSGRLDRSGLMDIDMPGIRR